MRLPADQVQEAHERWYQANARFNTRKQLERESALKEQELQAVSQTADFSDINELFKDLGRGPHMLELDFEPLTKDPTVYVSSRTGNETKCWKWRHKYTGKEVSRYPTSSGKSYDTGVLSIILNRLNQRTHKIAFERARHILRLNSKKGQANVELGAVAVPKKDREELLKQWVSLVCSMWHIICFRYVFRSFYITQTCLFLFHVFFYSLYR